MLEKHIRAHTGERPYPCDVCGFSFKTKSNLYKHCKSRAHVLKSNLEEKKQKLREQSGLGLGTSGDSDILDSENRSIGDLNSLSTGGVKRVVVQETVQKEPAQRHVIQEVLKYLEKGKERRPNEVQTERQRAKLERLKSVQERTLAPDSPRKTAVKMHRQFSLPILPTTSRPHPVLLTPSTPMLALSSQIATPTGTQVQYHTGSHVNIMPKLVLGLRQGSENLESVDERQPSELVEIVNLPDPDTDPVTATKALRDLEELSEKLSKYKKDGMKLSTSVRNLEDRRIQVRLELVDEGSDKPAGQEFIPLVSSVLHKDMTLTEHLSTPVTANPLVKSALSSKLKERIQQIISDNEAIIDTPKLDPPRPKCLKRNLSRQDSDMVARPLDISDSPLAQLLPPESAGMQNIHGTITDSHGQIASQPQRVKSVIQLLDKSNQPEQTIVIENPPHAMNFPGYQLTSTLQNATPASNPMASTAKSALNQKLRACLELPLTTTYVPLPKNPVILAQLNRANSATSVITPSGQSVIMSPDAKSSTGIRTPIASASVTNQASVQVHTPGHMGKMALKNLQMRSKSLSSLQAQTSQTPITPLTPGQAVLGAAMPVATVGASVIKAVSIAHVSAAKPVQPTYAIVQQTPTVMTPSGMQNLLIQASPGSGQPQYILQMPAHVSTPMAQMVVSSGSVPMMILPDATTVMTSQAVLQQPYIIQSPQTPQLSRSTSVGFIQTPVMTPTHIIPDVLHGYQPVQIQQQGQQIILQSAAPVTPVASVAPLRLASQPLKAATSAAIKPIEVRPGPSLKSVKDPRLGQGTDPKAMKILSSIVSNTVNQTKLESTAGSKDLKEIKIEIKFPPKQPPTISAKQVVLPKQSSVQHSPSSVLSSPTIITLSSPSQGVRPKILQRQDSVSGSPVSFLPPAHAGVTQKPEVRKTPTVAFRFDSPDVSKVPNTFLKLQSSGNLALLTSGQPITSLSSSFKPIIKEVYWTQEVSSGGQANVDKVPNRSMLLPVQCQDLQENSEHSPGETGLMMKCPYCGISFKKPATLELHMACYCKMKKQTGAENSPTVGSPHNINKELVAKMFNQPALAAALDQQRVRFGVKNVQEQSNITLVTLKSEVNPRLKDVVTEESSGLKQSRWKTLKPKMYGELIKKNLQSKLKGRILKRKLKGKLLMKRSLSCDASSIDKLKKQSTGSRDFSKSRLVDPDLYKGPVPVKHPRLVRSIDDSVVDGIRIQRPVFTRSESVPEVRESDLPSTDGETEEMLDSPEEGIDTNKADDNADVNNWQLKDVNVKVVTADCVVNRPEFVRPIYQQNFKMKAFAGMGTPLQFLPSATLTPRPDLMEIEKVRKMFTFDAKTLKLIAKPDSGRHVSGEKDSDQAAVVKTGTDEDMVATDQSTSTKRPTNQPPTVKRVPLVRQFSLVGNTYPSMRSMTHLTFCTTDRLQPSYVKSSKKISMYSNWKVAPQNPNPLGLATRAVLSLYNSRYTTNPVWVTNCGDDPRKSLITHSSYWKQKQGSDGPEKVSVSKELLKKKADKSVIKGGYKSSAAYVYVRGRGRGKYVCHTCGIRCKKPSMLKKHIRTHTDLRPYKCKQCKFCFKTKGNLTKHMKSKSHLKKCMDLGIYPVPMEVDDTHIDESALRAQCNLSKQAKIIDKTKKLREKQEDSVESVDVEEEPVEYMDEGDSDEELAEGWIPGLKSGSMDSGGCHDEEDEEEDDDDGMEIAEGDDQEPISR